MRIIAASATIKSIPTYEDALASFERAARTCYQSHDRIGPDSAEKLLHHCLERGHESTIEHLSMTVRFVVDRGVSHELVHHQLTAFSQESTRYCRYNEQIQVIAPPLDAGQMVYWQGAMQDAECDYLNLLRVGAPPELARSVLPTSLKTELVMTANFREWRHVFRLRTAPAAHPQMREVMVPLLAELRSSHPGFFEGLP